MPFQIVMTLQSNICNVGYTSARSIRPRNGSNERQVSPVSCCCSFLSLLSIKKIQKEYDSISSTSSARYMQSGFITYLEHEAINESATIEHEQMKK